jgi:hypothetical protein
MTLLALNTGTALSGRLPLSISIHMQFAVNGRRILFRLVLMAGGAETAVLKRLVDDETVMGQVACRLLSRRRAETLMSTHMTGGTYQTVIGQLFRHPGRYCGGRLIRPLLMHGGERFLFRQRRVTGQTLITLLLIHEFQLPLDAQPHGLVMQATTPLFELFGMTCAAVIRVK